MDKLEIRKIDLSGWITLCWGVGGVALLLGSAVLRLWPVVVGSFPENLRLIHVLGYLVSVIFMAYSEGYKAFQKAFSPRVVRRGFYLAQNPRLWHSLVAPMFCMGLVHASRRRKTASWIVSIGVIGLIVLVKQVPQPWRGIIDAGVVVGLTWGLFFIAYFFFHALRGIEPPASLDLPCRET